MSRGIYPRKKKAKVKEKMSGRHEKNLIKDDLVSTYNQPTHDQLQSQLLASIDSVQQTLDERANKYGDFKDHARITQRIKNSFNEGRNWENLDDDMRECLEMIAHKIGRILNGDPYYADSWHDIQGYAKLVEDRLNESERN